MSLGTGPTLPKLTNPLVIGGLAVAGLTYYYMKRERPSFLLGEAVCDCDGRVRRRKVRRSKRR